MNPVIVVPLSRYGTPGASEISGHARPAIVVIFVFHRRKSRFFEKRRRGRIKGRGRRGRPRENARDGSIAAVEIEITRLSAHPSYRDGRRFPLKVHQIQANPFRLPPPPPSPPPGSHARSLFLSLSLAFSLFHPRAGSADGIISPVVMIIAQHRAVSHRIAPSRPENWLFCITMTSVSLQPSFSLTCSLSLCLARLFARSILLIRPPSPESSARCRGTHGSHPSVCAQDPKSGLFR